jgi:hypothetical protein
MDVLAVFKLPCKLPSDLLSALVMLTSVHCSTKILPLKAGLWGFHSEETRSKMSAAKLGIKRYVRTSLSLSMHVKTAVVQPHGGFVFIRVWLIK